MRRRSRGVLVGSLALVAVAVTALPALAQGADARDLIPKIQRLERALTNLESYVYGGWQRPETGQPAAPPKTSDIAATQAAHLQIRISELETELRNLTGHVEEVRFKIDRVEERLNKLVEDVDFRLTALERDVARTAEMAEGAAAAAPPAAAPGPEPGTAAEATPAPAPGPEPGTAAPPAAEETAVGLAPGPRTIATITPTDLAKLQEGAAAPPEPKRVLPEGTPKERYDFAVGLLRQGDWADAQVAFEEFVTSHPEDALAANAQYWLGETFYVRQEFEQAAAKFLEGYQKFPAAPKAPDSLLKLGMSLAHMGETEEACRTFAAVLEKHPDAPASITRLVDKERQRVGCG